MAQIGHKVANHMFLPYLVKRPIPFFSLSKVVCFEDLQVLGDVYATIRQDRSDQGSLPGLGRHEVLDKLLLRVRTPEVITFSKWP